MIKWLAMIFMIIDHLGMLFIDVIPEQAYLTMRVLGRFSFPIFVYYTVLAVIRTSNIEKYLIRLLSFGLLSEASIRLFSTFKESQFNVIISFFVYGLIYYIYESRVSFNRYIRVVLIVILVGFVSLVEYSYYGLAMFFILLVISKSSSNNKWILSSVSILALSILSLITGSVSTIQPFAAFAGIVMFEDRLDKRLFSKNFEKWAFYIIYPTQWIIFYAISMLM